VLEEEPAAGLWAWAPMETIALMQTNPDAKILPADAVLLRSATMLREGHARVNGCNMLVAILDADDRLRT
jgi:hypothetical protein